MNSRQLEYVIAVAEEKSISRAAQRLHISQPSLSQYIRNLEKELRDFSNARMAEYKWIRIIEFSEEIPKTISGKICKAALRR